MACRKGHGPWDPGNQKCILRAHPSLPPHFPPSLLISLPSLGEAKELSDCSPRSPCRPGPWTSMSSGRRSGGCSRAWMAPGPVPTHPRCAGTCSAVSVGRGPCPVGLSSSAAPPAPAPSLPSSHLVPPGTPTWSPRQNLTPEHPSLHLSPSEEHRAGVGVGGGWPEQELFPSEEALLTQLPFSLPTPPPLGLHSCLPAPAPPALRRPPRCLTPLAPVAASAPAPGAPPEAPTPPAPAGPGTPRSPCCPRLPAPMGRLWPPLLPAGRGPSGSGAGRPCPLGPPAGLALGPALRAALRGTCGSEPCGPGPACHCHSRPCRDPRPHPHPQAGPCLCPLLPTQAPAAGGQPWLHRPGCQR